MADADQIAPLIAAERIAARVAEMAREIAADREGDLLAIVILKGSFVFAADLIRALHAAGTDPRVDFMTLASYGEGTESSGSVTITHDIAEDVTGRSVLLIDDILESGRTLSFAANLLRSRGARRVRTCVLLDKHERRRVSIEADYVGFRIGNEFVVGYGLDLAHRYRGLPYIAIVRQPQ